MSTGAKRSLYLGLFKLHIIGHLWSSFRCMKCSKRSTNFTVRCKVIAIDLKKKRKWLGRKERFTSQIIQIATQILECIVWKICLSRDSEGKEAALSYYNMMSCPCREKLNSINLLLYMSPIAVLVLLPASLIMEPNVIDVITKLGKEHKFMWLLLSINSVLAYSANLSNFLVTKHTSALTLQVLVFPSSLFTFYQKRLRKMERRSW